jgi:hypothetical protein
VVEHNDGRRIAVGVEELEAVTPPIAVEKEQDVTADTENQYDEDV